MSDATENKITRDPYLISAFSIEVPLGLTVVEAAKLILKPLFVRTREIGKRDRFGRNLRDNDEFLSPGAAVGVDCNGLARHIWPWQNLRGFIGFVEENVDKGMIVIWERGEVILNIEGIKPQDQGRTVYALDLNTFILDKKVGGLEIGVIHFVLPDQKDLASVAFKPFNDREPLDLHVST